MGGDTNHLYLGNSHFALLVQITSQHSYENKGTLDKACKNAAMCKSLIKCKVDTVNCFLQMYSLKKIRLKEEFFSKLNFRIKHVTYLQTHKGTADFSVTVMAAKAASLLSSVPDFH